MANNPLVNKISENYEILKVLGQGRYGQVVKCFKRDTEETVAVKILKERHENARSIRELHELAKLRRLDPDKSSIVRCHEWFCEVDQVFIVFEMLQMSLQKLLKMHGDVPIKGIQTIVKDVATALNAMKGLGMIHTDLKMDNIMLVDHQRQPFRVKLIDFGLAMKTSETRPEMVVQPLWHRSPEVILGNPFNEAIDVWSLGTILAELLTGHPPFPGSHDYDVLNYIIDSLGKPPKRLLDNGVHTSKFYPKRASHLVFTDWKLMTPQEYYSETGIKSTERGRFQLFFLCFLKLVNLDKGNSAEAAHKSDLVELMMKMLKMDPRKRITPNEILEHLCIVRSIVSPSSHNETAAAETSESRAVSREDMTEAKTDNSLGMEVLPGVILVQPVESVQPAESTEQSKALNESPQVVENMTTNTHLAEDESDCTGVSSPLVPPNSSAEVHDCALQKYEPKMKKTKNRNRRFFSTLKRRCFSCCCVPEDDDN